MRIVRVPAKSGGRPRIYGTVLAGRRERIVLVRLAYSLAENAGNTKSRQVECWIGIGVDSGKPRIVRRCGGKWQRFSRDDAGLRAADIDRAIAACRLTPKLTSQPDWPWSIWDRRVILPDDRRFPAAAKGIGRLISSLLADRNNCTDDEVRIIDAQILAISLKEI